MNADKRLRTTGYDQQRNTMIFTDFQGPQIHGFFTAFHARLTGFSRTFHGFRFSTDFSEFCEFRNVKIVATTHFDTELSILVVPGLKKLKVHRERWSISSRLNLPFDIIFKGLQIRVIPIKGPSSLLGVRLEGIPVRKISKAFLSIIVIIIMAAWFENALTCAM